MIFELKDSKSWDPVVGKVLNSILGDTYPNILKNNSVKIENVDCATGGFELFSEKISGDEIINATIKEFKKSFTEAIFYHGCRPENVKSYYKDGIIPLSKKKMEDLFKERFKGYATTASIDKAIEKVQSKKCEAREGYVYAGLDDRFLLKHCGHYLIYGSEYQFLLASELFSCSENCIDILKKYGRATIFNLKLPFDYIEDLEDLVFELLADHFYRIAHNNNEVLFIDYTITLKEPIPPTAIITHYCPTKISDSYKQAIWNDESGSYEYSFI